MKPADLQFKNFPFQLAAEMATAVVEKAYHASTMMPAAAPGAATTPAPGCGQNRFSLPSYGAGIAGFEQQVEQILANSSRLAAADMMGHMDTAPHPVAAFGEAVVAALNNNLLFRELSPFASDVEEFLIADIGDRLGLTDQWHGTFVSGGSLANLTCLFAALGGFEQPVARTDCMFFVPECAHASVLKAAAVLGLPRHCVCWVEGDAQGRASPENLSKALSKSTAKRKVVIAVSGSTVHGAVENLPSIATVCRSHQAWLHVDAIYGGALCFSHEHQQALQGLAEADSVVVGPQKWMYVPRLSAMLWVRGSQRFNDALDFGHSYSVGSTDATKNQTAGADSQSLPNPHRGQWGIQGSRRADALVLWMVLNYIGTDALGHQIDRSINVTRQLHARLENSEALEATHYPDLNLQCFGLRDRGNSDNSDRLMIDLHSRLGYDGLAWVSLTRWRERHLFRAVLLSPQTGAADIETLVDGIENLL